MTLTEAVAVIVHTDHLVIHRKGWNGKGMFVFYVGELDWVLEESPLSPWKNKRKSPFLAMKTADDRIVPWVASQDDILAIDWEVLNA